MNLINGVGELALYGAKFAEEWGVKGEFVTGIGGGTNRSKGGEINVEG